MPALPITSWVACHQGPTQVPRDSSLRWLLPTSISLCEAFFRSLGRSPLSPQPSSWTLGSWCMNAPAPFLSGDITLRCVPDAIPQDSPTGLGSWLDMPSMGPHSSQINSLCSQPCLRVNLGEPRLPQVSYLPSPCLHFRDHRTGRTTVHSPRVMVMVSKDSVGAKCQVCACHTASAQWMVTRFP